MRIRCLPARASCHVVVRVAAGLRGLVMALSAFVTHGLFGFRRVLHELGLFDSIFCSIYLLRMVNKIRVIGSPDLIYLFFCFLLRSVYADLDLEVLLLL